MHIFPLKHKMFKCYLKKEKKEEFQRGEDSMFQINGSDLPLKGFINIGTSHIAQGNSKTLWPDVIVY